MGQNFLTGSDLTAKANSILSQSSSIPEQNVKRHALNDVIFTSSVTDDIRSILSKTMKMSILDDNDGHQVDITLNSHPKDSIMNEYLQNFADRIDLKSKEIASNISTVLDRLDQSFSSSTYSYNNLDYNVLEFGDHFQIDELSLLPNFSLSLVSIHIH